MDITKLQLGGLYINNVLVDYSAMPVSYSSGLIELRTSLNQINFVQVIDGYKTILISDKVVTSNVSYNILKTQSLVNGDIVLTLSSVKYKVRLMTSEEYDKYICNGIGTLVTPTGNDKVENYYTSSTITESESNNLWNWYNSKTITSTFSGNSVVIRGGASIDKTSLITTTTQSSDTGFRIVLEKWSQPPTISISSGNMGNYTLYFSKKYTVTDVDESDSLTVYETLDNVAYRTLTSVTSGTTLEFSFKDNWDSISAGKHTFKITVVDGYSNSTSITLTFTKVVQDSGTATGTLSRPSIVIPSENVSSLSPKNAQDNITINFTVSGGDLVAYNELLIYKVTSNSSTIIYNSKIQTYSFEHTIPSNTLTNSSTDSYQLKIRTYNSNNQYSEWSDLVSLKCLSPAELIITTIVDGEITNSNPNFVATYEQAEGDVLYSYQYLLYSDEGTLLDYSSELKDGLLTWQLTNTTLENKTNYTIELITISESGLTSTLTQDFYCIFTQTRLPATVEISTDNSEGAVTFTSYVRQILGEIIYGDSIKYIDSEFADLHDVIVSFNANGAFRNEGDFTLKLWAKDLEGYNNMLLKVVTSDGYILLSRYGNLFTVAIYKNEKKLYQQYQTIEGDILTDDEFYFFIQYNSNYGLLNFDVKRYTDGRTTWFTAKTSNDIVPSYSAENGFLTYLPSKFKNYLIDTTIDGKTNTLYLPSKDEIENAESFNISSILGVGKIGSMILNTSSTNEQLRSDVVSYFTRTQDTTDANKLVVVGTDGSYSSEYPNSTTIGTRIIFNVSKDLQVTNYKKDGYYHMALYNGSLNLFQTQSIGNLIQGSKIKCNSIKYNNSIIEFTVMNTNPNLNYVTLISNVIFTNKEYDKEEDYYVYGNTDWNTSNIKQWLNSDEKIG